MTVIWMLVTSLEADPDCLAVLLLADHTSR